MICTLKNIYYRIYDHRKFYITLIILIIIFITSKMIINQNPLVDKKSPYYINSIYMSDGRIYNDYLNSSERKMYDLIMNKINSTKSYSEEKLSYYGCNSYQECSSLVNKATNAIIVDHPELLSFAGYTWKYESNTGLFTVKARKSFKLPLMNDIGEMIINKKIDKIQEETKNMSDKEKVKYVYNWIGTNTEYDRIFTYDNKNQTIYNVFVNKNAVCAGFAKASTVIFQSLGIEAYSVLGTTTDNHMWNIIKIDDEYYFFDSTVASCIKESNSHYYDGLKQSNFSNYSLSYKEWYPNVSNKELFNDSEL